jgi:hypothetical protein
MARNPLLDATLGYFKNTFPNSRVTAFKNGDDDDEITSPPMDAKGLQMLAQQKAMGRPIQTSEALQNPFAVKPAASQAGRMREPTGMNFMVRGGTRDQFRDYMEQEGPEGAGQVVSDMYEIMGRGRQKSMEADGIQQIPSISLLADTPAARVANTNAPEISATPGLPFDQIDLDFAGKERGDELRGMLSVRSPSDVSDIPADGKGLQLMHEMSGEEGLFAPKPATVLSTLGSSKDPEASLSFLDRLRDKRNQGFFRGLTDFGATLMTEPDGFGPAMQAFQQGIASGQEAYEAQEQLEIDRERQALADKLAQGRAAREVSAEERAVSAEGRAIGADARAAELFEVELDNARAQGQRARDLEGRQDLGYEIQDEIVADFDALFSPDRPTPPTSKEILDTITRAEVAALGISDPTLINSIENLLSSAKSTFQTDPVEAPSAKIETYYDPNNQSVTIRTIQDGPRQGATEIVTVDPDSGNISYEAVNLGEEGLTRTKKTVTGSELTATENINLGLGMQSGAAHRDLGKDGLEFAMTGAVRREPTTDELNNLPEGVEWGDYPEHWSQAGGQEDQSGWKPLAQSVLAAVLNNPTGATLGGGATAIQAILRTTDLITPQALEAHTEALNFINPVVRYLSGAQMTNQEAQRYYGALIPVPGEPPVVTFRKRRRREGLLLAMGLDPETGERYNAEQLQDPSIQGAVREASQRLGLGGQPIQAATEAYPNFQPYHDALGNLITTPVIGRPDAILAMVLNAYPLSEEEIPINSYPGEGDDEWLDMSGAVGNNATLNYSQGRELGITGQGP